MSHRHLHPFLNFIEIRELGFSQISPIEVS
jgi:hypothetical protein